MWKFFPVLEIYWYIAIFSSVLMLIIILLSIIGIDSDGLEIEFLGEYGSVNSIIAFLFVGSWTGFLSYKYTAFGDGLTLIVSIGAGTASYFGTILLLQKLKGLESSGNINIQNAIGKKGKVYLGIPGKKEGSGQVQILLEGRLKTLNALSLGETIPTGTEIIVFDIENNHLVVEPYSEDI
ncbi:MAG: hypothetical protein AAF363_01315 [Bacteroidota bacterium]